MNILITSAGRRVSLVRAFQKALKDHMPGSQVFAADAKPTLSAACQVADDYVAVPRLDEAGYIDALLNYCLDRDIRMIIPTIDTELMLLAQHKKDFVDKGIHAVVASPDFVGKCRDKRQIHAFFDSYGIGVAREYPKDDYTLPIFIKPVDGSRSVDTYLIREESELRPYHFENEKLMFLEYLDHGLFDEYTCDLYYDRDHNLKCAVPRKRIEVRDGEVNKGVTVKNELIPFIREHLATVEGAVGCLTAQFFMHRTEKSVYGIEINPRFGGGFPLSYLAGANYPEWLVREYFLGEKIPDQFEVWEQDLLMLRYDDEILVHGYKG